MKKKKIAQVLAALLATGAVVSLASCDKKDDNIKPEPTPEVLKYTVTYNANGHGTAPAEAKDLTNLPSTLPTLTDNDYDFGGWYKDAACTQPVTAGEALTANITLYAKWTAKAQTPKEKFVISFDTDGGNEIAPIEIEDGQKIDLPDTPTKASFTKFHKTTSYTFAGWFNGDTEVTSETIVTSALNLKAKWTEVTAIDDGYEAVQSFLDLAELQLTGKLTESASSKGYTLEKGVEGRSRAKSWKKTDYSADEKLPNCDLYNTNENNANYSFAYSVKINNTAGISFTSNGDGIVKVYAQNGSSGAGGYVYITVKNITDGTSQDIAMPGKSDSYNSPVAQLSFEVEKGKEYQILRTADSGTIDVYGIETDAVAQVSEETGIEISKNGTDKFFAGEEFNTDGLAVVATKQSGAKIPLTSNDFSIKVLDSNSQEVNYSNGLVAGSYKVQISYKTFEVKTYDIEVYSLDSILLGKNVTTQGGNDGFNGTYVNHTLKQVYKKGSTLDLDGLTVYGIAVDNAYKAKVIYQVSSVDMSTTGEKIVTVTVSLGGVEKTATFVINVVDTELATEIDGETINAINLYVDKNYTGEIGAKQNVGLISKDCNTFKTIQQAIDFIEDNELPNTAFKNIYLAAGIYNEKLEITVPGTKLIGLEGKDKTKIEWNSVYGIDDEGGYSQVTDSTQTIAIRRSASNVTIKGITVSNYYNNISKYAGTAYEGSGERGLALLVQADMFIMEDGSLLGWQDTLETFTGRQYFKNTYICGCVDFIFGTNSTTYFDNCQIEAIKGKSNITTEDKTAAYVTAYKGVNQNGTEVQYGAIFNECSFTTSTDYIGKVALARPWGAYSAVAYINSTFTDKYLSSEKETIAAGLLSNTNIATLKIKIYGCKYVDGSDFVVADTLDQVDTTLTAEEVANYTNYSVIFGTTNGKVSYNLAWNPESTEIAVDKNIYYNFRKESESTGTNYNFATDGTDNVSSGNILEKNGLTIDCTSGKAAWNESSGMYNFKSGAKIKLNVNAGSIITIKFYSSAYAYATIDGKYTTTDTYQYYVSEGGEVVIDITGDTYIKEIIVMPEQLAPTDASLDSIELSGVPAGELQVGTDLDLTNLKVKANYSDNTYKFVTDFTTNADSIVNKDTEGKYTVTVNYQGKTATFDVKYVNNVSDTFEEDIVLDFATGKASETLSNPKITASNDLAYNNGNFTQLTAGTFSFKVKAGAHVVITDFGGQYGHIMVNGTSTSGNGAIIDATEDMTITIGVGETGAQYSYLKSISITYPVPAVSQVISTTTRIAFGSDNDYKSNNLVTITATAVDNTVKDTKFYGGNIEFKVAAGAKVSIMLNYSCDFTYNGTRVQGKVGTGEGQIAQNYVLVESTAEETTIVIECDTDSTGDNYFYWIDITFAE